MSVMRIRPVSILLTAIAVIWGRPALVIRMLPANGLFGRRGRCPHTEGKRRPVAPRQLLRVVRDRRRAPVTQRDCDTYGLAKRRWRGGRWRLRGRFAVRKNSANDSPAFNEWATAGNKLITSTFKHFGRQNLRASRRAKKACFYTTRIRLAFCLRRVHVAVLPCPIGGLFATHDFFTC